MAATVTTVPHGTTLGKKMTADLTLWFDDAEHWQFRRERMPGSRTGGLSGSGATELAASIGHADAEGVDEDALPRVTLLLPAARVLSAEVTVPARSRRQLLRALPFAVEERLAIDLDTVHIAHAALRPNERTQVRAVELAWFEAVLAQVRALGLAVDAVHVDADCVPVRGDLSLYLDTTRALLRTRGGRMLAVDRRALGFTLDRICPALKDSAGAPLVATAFVLAEAPLSSAERSAIEAAIGSPGQAGNLDVEPVIDPLALLAAPAEAASRAGAVLPLHGRPVAIDLLQGRFAVRRALNIDWRPWKPVALAAAVLLLLLPMLEAGKAWRYGRAAALLEDANAALYRQYFPGEAVPRDLRRSFESRLGEDDGAAVGFRPLLAALADGVGKARGFELQSVSYQRERDELAVQVLAGSLADLERFKNGFAAHRVVAEVSSADQEKERVRARLRIHGDGGGGS